MAYEFNIAEAINVIRDLVGPDRRKARELGLTGMSKQNDLTGAQTRQADATTERISSMTPAEIAQLNAQTGLTGAQTVAAEGTESRAAGRENLTREGLKWDNLLKSYNADTFKDMTAAQIESLVSGAEASRGQGAYYQENANAVQPRLQLEREELTQRGELGRSGLKSQERGTTAQLLDTATRMYPQNPQFIRYLQDQLGYTPAEGEGGVDSNPARDKLLGWLSGDVGSGPMNTDPYLSQLFQIEQEGKTPTSKGSPYGLPSYPTGGAKRHQKSNQPAHQPTLGGTTGGQQTPMPSIEGTSIENVLHWLRNLLDSAGIKR